MDGKKVSQDFHDRILNECRFDEAENLVVNDVVFRLNQNEELIGMDAFRSHISVFQDAFPDLTYRTKCLLEDGNIVTLHWECKGTHKNNLGEIPATGKRVEIHGISLFLIKDGRITENIVYFNEAEIPKQLGVI